MNSQREGPFSQKRTKSGESSKSFGSCEGNFGLCRLFRRRHGHRGIISAQKVPILKFLYWFLLLYFVISSGRWRKCANSAICAQAAIESVPLKQQIFADLEKYCKPTCLLASNTSTIDLGLIGKKTKSQDRIIGAHFFRLTCWLLFQVLVDNCQRFVVSCNGFDWHLGRRATALHMWCHSWK